MKRHPLQWVTALGLALVAACASAPTANLPQADIACAATTISALTEHPQKYSGRTICVSGYLGKMVSHGEDEAALYRTASEAEARRVDQFISIGIPMTLENQKRLASRSLQKVRAVGRFEYDARCWAARGRREPEYQCSPRLPMKVGSARITFPDGTVMP